MLNGKCNMHCNMVLRTAARFEDLSVRLYSGVKSGAGSRGVTGDYPRALYLTYVLQF